MKKYIVYDDYNIGYIRDICKCEKCKERGRAEVFINDLDDKYLDCIKANGFDRIVYLGDSLSDALKEIQDAFEDKVRKLNRENVFLQKLVDLYSELKCDKSKFTIKVTPTTAVDQIAKYGDVKLDARQWRDVFTLTTSLSFEEVFELPFILSVETEDLNKKKQRLYE